MRSKRFLTMLLVLSMLLSMLAPVSAAAVTAGSDSFAAADQQSEASEEKKTSPFENGLILSGEAEQEAQKNLREDPLMVPEVETPNADISKDGKWTATESSKVPTASLTLSEIPECVQELQKAAEVFEASERVAAFVVLEAAPLAERYSSIAQVNASEERAMLDLQDSVITEIERTLLKGGELEVRYQFTYLTNAFTIATEFENLEKIAKLDGVKSVFIMPVYDAVPTDAANPNTSGAGTMTGVHDVWQELGYTGQGMKIAIIDTGLDLDHPSFAAEPELTDSSLTVADINAVLKELNAYAKRGSITGETLYRSGKVPYAFNYVDNSLTADHSNDQQGDHGTHVAGIAAANKLDSTSVVGMAPDAQIIVMKVFGAAGGAYTDDIVAALEDAMTLGCDVVNASLGSPAGFTSSDTEIDLIYQRLASQDIIATISAGNEGTSSYDNMWGTDMNRTDNPDNATAGSPGIYANATTIASADNGFVMGDYFTVGEEKIFFMDNYEYLVGTVPWSLRDFAGQEMEYVIVPGLGEEADYEGLDVEGKIAIVMRGTINFSTKVQNAEFNGAAGVIIWNNNDTDDIFSFGMRTDDEATGYYPSIPVGLITLSSGSLMEAAEEKVLVVAEEMGMREDPNGGQMSSFSSWGVAPDLSLEPDITGIGGNVYSCYDGGKYGLMSGTSMSAPQVAGITALVMQYLYELYPNSPDGSIREMAQALLMSTADPIITAYGTEASPRQQGAGLVDALEATTTKAYLTVGGNAPKAELGDSTSGKYTFSFEIHNFGTEEKTYVLESSLLTEAAASAGSGLYFMYGVDVPLSGSVTFDKDSVTVPAGGKSNVMVSIELSDEDKAMFAEAWKNGGYVEGFVYLCTETEDGGLIPELNLPFLGFYGDWTKAPVFDSGYWYDNGFWGLNSVNGLPEAEEYYHVMWTSLAGTDWVLGMNPYSGAYTDQSGKIVYDPAHNVLSPNGDGILDGITEMYLSLLRNAKTLTFTYSVDGEIVHRETSTNNSKTMYRSNYGQVIPWIYSWYGSGMYDFTDAEGNVLPSGTEVILSIDATVDYGLGGNHNITIPLYVDTTKPEMLAVQTAQLEDGTDVLAVMGYDETALASIVVMNPSGTSVYAQGYDANMTDNGDGSYIGYFDISELGTEFLVAVCDYAGNESYYEVSYEAEDGNLPEMDNTQLYAYRVFDDAIYSDHMYGWVSMDPPAAEDESVALSIWTDDYLEYAAINAAEYVDGKIFAVDAVYNLVVLDPGLFNRTTICNLGVNVIDMTFDDSTDTMYVLSKQGNYMYLYSMDLTTGALTQLKNFGYYTGAAPYAIADDDNGTIYAIKYNSANLYTLDVAGGTYAMSAITTTVDGVESNLIITDSDGINVGPNYAQSITYKDGKLYWAYFKNYYNWYLYSDLITIDTTTWEFYAKDYTAYAYDASNTLVQYAPYTELVGLLTLTDTEYQIPEATALTDLVLSDEALLMTVGENATVTASALPWNYDLGELTWTTSDEAVATVSAGRITGVGEGTATITVATEGIEKTIAVTVVDVSGHFNAYNYYSGDGYYGYMIDVDMATMNYDLTAESPVDWLAGDYNGHNGYFYGYSEGGQFWRYDQESGEAVKLGDPIGAAPVDMAYDYSTGLMYAATTDYNMGYSTINVVNLNTGALEPVFMAEYQYFITLACDGEGNLYTVTAFGELYKYTMENGYPVGMDLLLEGLGDVQYMQSMCWDHDNEVLLWAYCEYGSIVWIDPNAAEPYALLIGDPTGSGLFEFVGMYTVPAEIPALDYVAVQGVTAENMLILSGVTKTPNISVYPFNATTQNYTLTSDSDCVKVNADGTLTGVSEGLAHITGTLVDGENTFDIAFAVTVIDGADNVYGMVMTDLATMGGQTWYRIYVQDPSDPDILEYTDYIIYAEEYVDGILYAVGYDPNDWEGNWQFFTMDPVNHAIKSQADLGEAYPFVYDMTYDYTTSTMYAVAGPTDSDSDLFVFDMETGALIPLLQTEQFFMSLAAGPDGKLYAMENSKATVVDEWDPWAQPEYGNATLYTIDPKTGDVKLVGDTGVKANMLASMSYDYDTNRLYWTGFYQGAANVTGLYIVDTKTGAATNLGAIGVAGAQVSGLYIISDNFPTAGEPELYNLIVTPEKTSITSGASVTIKANTVPMNLDAEIVWTSSNEKVASVDANGVVTGLKQGKAVITATVTYNGVTLTDSCEIGVMDADAAFLTYNVTDGGWATISRADGSVTNLTEGTEETAVVAAASTGTTVYGYDEELNFFSVDPETGLRTAIGTADAEAAVAGWMTALGYGEEDIAAEKDYYTFQIRDLAYDEANDRFLVLGAVVDAEYLSEMNYGDAIYAVNLSDGSLTELYRFMDIYNVMAMTVGNDGTVYYYNSYNDYYSALDLSTGAAEDIISGQTQSLYGSTEHIHALYFDELTGLLYHLFTSNGNFYRLLSVDPTSRTLSIVFEYVGEVIYDDASWAYLGDSFAGLTFVEKIGKLDTPVIETANDTATGKIIVSWEEVYGAESYEILRSADKRNYELVATVTETAYTDTDAEAGTRYYYQVRAIAADPAANSELSNVKSRLCDLAAPEITLSNIASSGKIRVDWEPIEGAVKYSVYVSTDNENWSRLITTKGTSIDHISAEAGTRYYYKVRAISDVRYANSASSAVKSRLCDLARPVLTLSNIASSGKIKVQWESIEGAVKYKVYVSTNNKDWSHLTTTTNTSVNHTSAVAGTRYYYKVMAIAENTYANSAYSTVKNRLCDLARPTLKVTLNGKGKPVLSWNEVEGAVKYMVYRSTDKENWSYLITTTKTSVTNTGVKSGTTYYYKVKAVAENTNANSAFSDVKSVSIK